MFVNTKVFGFLFFLYFIMCRENSFKRVVGAIGVSGHKGQVDTLINIVSKIEV